MKTTDQEGQSLIPDVQAIVHRAPSIKHKPRSKRYYFDVGLGSVCLSGPDTGGAYCLLEVSLAPGMAVPRHTRRPFPHRTMRLLRRSHRQLQLRMSINLPPIMESFLVNG